MDQRMPPQVFFPVKRFAASLTRKRLLPGVSSQMVRESPPFRELLVTHVTDMQLLAQVTQQVLP